MNKDNDPRRMMQGWFTLPKAIPLCVPSTDELCILSAERLVTYDALALCRRRRFLWKIRHSGNRFWALTEPKPDRRWLCIYWPMAMNTFPMVVTTDVAKLWPGSWSNWPLGLIDAGSRPSIVLVTSPSDFIAAWHFIFAQGVKRTCAPVALINRSSKIPSGMLAHFRGKRVRIFPQIEQSGSSGPFSHAEAALQWQEQLLEAGARVDVFDLSGLHQAPLGAPAITTDLDSHTGRPVECLADVTGMGLDYERNEALKSMMRF